MGGEVQNIGTGVEDVLGSVTVVGHQSQQWPPFPPQCFGSPNRRATATLLNRQNPITRLLSAWWPGGRIKANPEWIVPCKSSSVRATALPAARVAVSNESGLRVGIRSELRNRLYCSGPGFLASARGCAQPGSSPLELHGARLSPAARRGPTSPRPEGWRLDPLGTLRMPCRGVVACKYAIENDSVFHRK